MRRSRVVVPALLMVMALVVGACGKSKSSSSSGTTTTAAAQSTTTAAASTPASGTSDLAVADNATLGKKIIVDGTGKTVYMYMPDGTSKTSTVSASIKANWPPVKAAASTPKVSSDLDQSKVAVDMQSDGTNQLAYNGHLLYTFVNDTAAGDAKGNGLGNVWYARSATGDKLA
jgi:predicted lipoprotein with Yx(FWY)xxD motif